MAISAELVARHLAQLAIERLVADEEAGMQHGLAAVAACARGGCRMPARSRARKPSTSISVQP